MTTRMMFEQSAERAREDDTPQAKRTAYVVKSTTSAFYAGHNRHWVELAYARKFDFMTTAMAYAIELGYTVDEFTVEAV